VVAAGFEAPERFVAPFGSPAVLGEAGMEGFVVEFEGVAVAAAMGVRSGDAMAVVNVAVPPQYRRRGFGEVATSAVLAHAARSGSRIVFLHATPMGLPLYERLGFVIAERWTMILPEAA
jgi:ribosomal protein S18 acetylase RimI-like enzyme